VQIVIDDRIVNKTFKKHKDKTPELLRLYYLCNQSFSKRSGIFTLDELADLLADQGYKSLRKNQGGNRHKKIKELRKLLQSAPELFIQTNDNIFRTVSKKRIHRLKASERVIDYSLFHKDNKREFYDLIIGIPGDNKTVDYITLKQATGYTTARICQATTANNKKGHILKVNNIVSLSKYSTWDEAYFTALKLYKESKKSGKHFLTHIVPIKEKVYNRFNPTQKPKYQTLYHVCFYAANSYTSKVMLSNDSATLQPILSKEHESNVFELVNNIKSKVRKGIRKFSTISFMNNAAIDNFYYRQCNA